MLVNDINIYAIEAVLPVAALNVRAKLIDEAIERALIWLTPDPKSIEVINIVVYKNYDMEQNFPHDIVEMRKLVEKMFDDNMSLVFIHKTRQTTTPGTLFSSPKIVLSETETRNHLFTKLALDIARETDHIKEFLSALKNPRVILTIAEHQALVGLLKRYNINLADYYT